MPHILLKTVEETNYFVLKNISFILKKKKSDYTIFPHSKFV